MPDAPLDQDTELLQRRGGYDWLIHGPESWFAEDVAEKLTSMGIRVTRKTVGEWFKDLPNTQNFGKLGLSATRADLIHFFAEKFVNRAANE
jgi:hypothetical protein